MAFQDFFLRARRPASLVKFNTVLPTNFKLIVKANGMWQARVGASLDPIPNLTLVEGDQSDWFGSPPVISPHIHYNLRVIGGPEVAHHAWSGWDGLFITNPEDPDFDDPTLDKSKLKRWFKNNGVERLDNAADHPRSSRTDMRWFRWESGANWLDITIDEPVFRRQEWAGD